MINAGPFYKPSGLLRAFGATAVLIVAGHATAAPLTVDPDASSVAVTFTQMNVPVDALFTGFDAQISFDPAAPADATATIRIDTASFDFGPGADEYNEEVRKEEWFHTDKYPGAVFEASGAKPAGPGKFEVPGKLTIKGMTKAVRAVVDLTEQGANYVFAGEVPVRRLDYGIGATEWKDTSIVADDVIVKFRITAARP